MRGNREALMGPRQPLAEDALVIVLLGASAVGKSTLAKHLCESGVAEATPTWTTRPPRRGERDTSYDHRFVSDEEFDLQSRKGVFLDERSLYGFRYGIPFLPKPPAGLEALIVLKPVFIPKFLQHYPAAKIHQIEASLDEVSERMAARGQSPEDIAKRMDEHEAETLEARDLADVILDNNGPIDQTLKRLEAEVVSYREPYGTSQVGEAIPLPVS